MAKLRKFRHAEIRKLGVEDIAEMMNRMIDVLNALDDRLETIEGVFEWEDDENEEDENDD